MRATTLGLLWLLAAAPAGDAVGGFRDRLKELDAKEKAAWDGFQNRFAEALAKFVRPWERAGAEPDYPQDATWDYAQFHPLYGDLVALREARAEAAETLVASGEPGAAAVVFDELLDICRRADEVEGILAGRLQEANYWMCDQRHGVLRHALGREERRLLPALARSPGAAAFLAGEGWKRAEKGDGGRSTLRRVATLDALALVGGPEARALLEKQLGSKGSTFRIAALEGLLRLGPETTGSLLPLLKDPSPVVRFALFDGLRAQKDPDPRWVHPILDSYPAATGRMRSEHLATLRRLTGQGLGDDPAAWKDWWEKNAASVNGGTFRPPAGDPARAPSAPSNPVCRFYGVPASTLRPIFLVDGSFVLHLPAEVAVQKTRNSRRWEHRPKARWEDPPPVHFAILRREWRKTLAAFPAGSAFALVTLYEQNTPHDFEDGRLLRPDPRASKESVEFLEGLGQAGHGELYEGLCEVMRVAGLDPSPAADDFPKPAADTVFVLHSGSPRGGRFVTADPVVDAFRRLNRFRRLAVHCIRIANGKDEAEAAMRGIAESSGGTYVWKDVPPPE